MIAKNRKIKKDKRFQSIFFSVLIGVFLSAVIGFFIVSNLRISQKRGELVEKTEELKKEVQLLEERNEQLKSGITQTESDAYWEAKLREQGYKKPGEEAVVVIPPEEKNDSAGSGENNIFENLLNFIRNFWESLSEKIGF